MIDTFYQKENLEVYKRYLYFQLKDDSRFFVCGRGVIVNLEHASDFKDSAFKMDDGSSVFVSREQLKTAKQTFMEFLFSPHLCNNISPGNCE
mgnify:CR=1 FL=1